MNTVIPQEKKGKSPNNNRVFPISLPDWDDDGFRKELMFDNAEVRIGHLTVNCDIVGIQEYDVDKGDGFTAPYPIITNKEFEVTINEVINAEGNPVVYDRVLIEKLIENQLLCQV